MIDWHALPDWVSAAANVGVAAAAGIAAYQGIKGLKLWREEALGKRRMELTEEVLSDFYEARDVMRWVRSPMSSREESSHRPGRDEETEDVQNARDPYYAPVKRLNDSADFFSRFRARRYRVIANFGLVAEKPYEDLFMVRLEILSAAHRLMRMATFRDPSDHLIQSRERYEDVIWESSDDDPINERLNTCVDVVESIFRNEIMHVPQRRTVRRWS